MPVLRTLKKQDVDVVAQLKEVLEQLPTALCQDPFLPLLRSIVVPSEIQGARRNTYFS